MVPPPKRQKSEVSVRTLNPSFAQEMTEIRPEKFHTDVVVLQRFVKCDWWLFSREN